MVDHSLRFNRDVEEVVEAQYGLKQNQHPQRDITEWDYQKGNLNQPTKDYSLEAARLATARGVMEIQLE